MKYYFSTEYINMAVSTKGDLYVLFKDTCKKISENLEGEIITYGNWTNFELSSRFINYWIKYETNSCIIIENDQMRNIIQSINYEDIILTGAGISRASGIPTQEEIEELLFLNNPVILYEKCRKKPKEIIGRLRAFCYKIITATPSKAHYMIKKIYIKSGAKILTENIDFLHEKTGISVIHIPKEIDVIENHKFNRVFLFGVGNPCCQNLLNRWEKQGTILYAVSLKKPNINVNCLNWCCDDIEDLLKVYV